MDPDLTEHTLPNCIHTLLVFRQTEVQSGVLACLLRLLKEQENMSSMYVLI
jgi:hypothetical protein